MRSYPPNKITGPNVGGPRQLPIPMPLAARVGQFGVGQDQIQGKNDHLQPSTADATVHLMDIVALQHELESLPVDQQDRVAAFLTALRLRRDGRMEEISQKLDDTDPVRWIDWDEAKQRFGMSNLDPDR